MKWITEIPAHQTTEEAITMSAQKWWNYGQCTQAELHSRDTQDCALCIKFRPYCPKCPLYQAGHGCLAGQDSMYRQAIRLLYKVHKSKTAFKKFQQKARRLARLIERLPSC